MKVPLNAYSVACNPRAANTHLDQCKDDPPSFFAKRAILQRLVHNNIGRFLQIHWARVCGGGIWVNVGSENKSHNFALCQLSYEL